MNYNAYNELMSYFYFEFNVYIILTLIIILGLIKSIDTYRKLEKSSKTEPARHNGRKYNLIISTLALIGLSNAMFFHGVMLDIPMESGYVWSSKFIYLFVVAFVLFSIQLIFTVLTNMSISKSKKD